MSAGVAVATRLDRRDGLLCGLLIVIALVLRLIGLNGGLWLDEINGLIDWMRPSFSEILTVWKGDGQHPLYALFAHASLTVLGEEPWSIRLPAVLFGVATVPLLYKFARDVGTRREAVLAALLLAVSYHHIWFSQNARGYTALTFFVLLATLFLVHGLRDWRLRWFMGWGVAIALGAYTHLTVAFPAFAHALVIVAVALGGGARVVPGALRVRAALAGFAVAGVLTLLLYAPILDQVMAWFLHRPSNFRGISTPAWAAAEALSSLRQGMAAGGGAIIGLTALVAGLVVMAAGALSWLGVSRTIFALFTLPAVVTFAGAFAVRGTMYPRFFFYLLPYMVLIAVRGALVLPALFSGARDPATLSDRRAHIGTAIAGAMIVVSAISLSYNYRHPKQDFAGALAFVEAERQPDEAVLLVGAVTGPYQRYFGRTWPEVTSVAGLDSIGSRVAGYWLLYTFPRYIEVRTPDLMMRIRDVCERPRTFPGTVGGGDITVCRVTKGIGPS